MSFCFSSWSVPCVVTTLRWLRINSIILYRYWLTILVIFQHATTPWTPALNSDDYSIWVMSRIRQLNPSLSSNNLSSTGSCWPWCICTTFTNTHYLHASVHLHFSLHRPCSFLFSCAECWLSIWLNANVVHHFILYYCWRLIFKLESYPLLHNLCVIEVM